MNNKKIIFIVALIIVVLEGCSKVKPVFKDFIGVWNSEDGCELILQDDSTYIIKNLNIGRLYIGEKDSLQNFIGKWDFKIHKRDEPGLGKIELLYKKDIDDFSIQFVFYVSGQDLLDNRPPWYLFEFIGGIDDYNKYILKKQQ